MCVVCLCSIHSHAEDAAPISVEIISERNTYVYGEGISVNIRITNISDKNFIHMPQGNFMAHTEIEVHTKEGVAVRRAMACWMYGEPIWGKGAERILRPGSMLEGRAGISGIYDLKPGEYIVTAKADQHADKESGIVPVSVTSKPMALTIQELNIQEIVTREKGFMTYALILADNELYGGSRLTQKKDEWNIIRLKIPRKTLEGITWGADEFNFCKAVIPGEGGSRTIVTVGGSGVQAIAVQPIQKADVTTPVIDAKAGQERAP